jgi:3-dehydroquinate synthase
MIEVRVELGARAYVVSVGRGLLGRLNEVLSAFAGRRLVLVSSARILARHGGAAERALRRLGRLSVVTMPDGEAHKHARTWQKLHDGFARAGLARDGLMVALGGGVVGDVAGFAAATWMRGLDWVQVPTTLLAMVDASVGGKVGFNHAAGKNLVGAFHQPRAVVADPDLLATLPLREWRGGAFEMLKSGLIGDRALFEHLERVPRDLRAWPPAALEQALAASVRLKARIVTRDEREAGLRRVLNLGHTMGHAFETVTAYRRFTHGEAVGWGLLGEAWLARRRGLLNASDHARLAAAVERLGPRPPVADLDPSAILRAVAHDKKSKDGQVAFVLPQRLGRVRIVDDVSRVEQRAALRALLRDEVIDATALPPAPRPPLPRTRGRGRG